MKNFKSLRTYLVLVMALGLSVAITSCGDDDSAPQVISAKDVEGNYTGKVLATPIQPEQRDAATDEPKGADVAAIVDAENVVFAKFPVKELIEALVPGEGAAAIIEALGDVTYKLPYKAALNKELTQINLTLAPEPLELEIALPPLVNPTGDAREGEEAPKTKVVVTISAADAGVFTYEGKTFKFKLMVEKVTVGAIDFPLSTQLSFDLAR